MKYAVRQNLDSLAQFDSRQDPHSAALTEQATFKSNVRKDKKNLQGRNSMTKVGINRDSTEQLDEKLFESHGQKQGNAHRLQNLQPTSSNMSHLKKQVA